MNPEWYEELTSQAQEAFVRGDLERSAACLQQAEDRAVTDGLDELSYEAFCRRCDVLIDLERLSEHNEVRRLKEILLCSQQPRTRWLAAHLTADAYVAFGNRERALHYAYRASELADETENPRDRATSANLVANLALVSSGFNEAEQEFVRALEFYESSGKDFEELMVAQLRDNLGYVYLCTDRLAEGIELCEQARESMDRLGAESHVHQPLQDLCYGYLLCDRLADAQSCGERGLTLALRIGDNLVAKNLFYLLAEVAVRSGDRFRASRYLNELSQFYPEIPCSDEIVDVLLGMDFTQVVNLRG